MTDQATIRTGVKILRIVWVIWLIGLWISGAVFSFSTIMIACIAVATLGTAFVWLWPRWRHLPDQQSSWTLRLTQRELAEVRQSMTESERHHDPDYREAYYKVEQMDRIAKSSIQELERRS